MDPLQRDSGRNPGGKLMPTPPAPLSLMKFAYTPINLFNHSPTRTTITSDAFEGGLPFDTPAPKVLLTHSVLAVSIPFTRTESYASEYGFAVLPKGMEVDQVRVQSLTVGAPNYTDIFFHLRHGTNPVIEYLVPAKTSGSDRWPTWTSTWSSSISAAMTCEFHLLGRLGLTSWGDYLILSAE